MGFTGGKESENIIGFFSWKFTEQYKLLTTIVLPDIFLPVSCSFRPSISCNLQQA